MNLGFLTDFSAKVRVAKSNLESRLQTEKMGQSVKVPDVKSCI